VRSADSFASLGWTWALSGNPGLAVASFKKGMELGKQNTDRVKQALASLYLAQEQDAKSEPMFQELVAKDPKNFTATSGLARVSDDPNGPAPSAPAVPASAAPGGAS
jgi:cytochrome c-type biogenesis protein CcmH/NrfG